MSHDVELTGPVVRLCINAVVENWSNCISSRGGSYRPFAYVSPQSISQPLRNELDPFAQDPSIRSISPGIMGSLADDIPYHFPLFLWNFWLSPP